MCILLARNGSWQLALPWMMVVVINALAGSTDQSHDQVEESGLTWGSWGEMAPSPTSAPAPSDVPWPDFSGPESAREPKSSQFRVVSPLKSGKSWNAPSSKGTGGDAFMHRGAYSAYHGVHGGHHLPTFHVSDYAGMSLLFIKNILSIIMFGVAAALLWKRRKDLIILFTGEDRIHASPLRAMWWTCFRCCGACSHEWTRSISSLPCCPEQLHGTNLVREAGATIGVATQAVEFSNIVLGDLPVKGRADFYVSFEYSANPAIKTSVAESKKPKVVHFPEVLTLRMRYSPLAGNLIISAYRLDLVGSVLLCSVSLKAPKLIAWSKGEVKTRRFAMRLPPKEEMHNTGPGIETPPWIALDITFPRSDLRQLDRFGRTDTVRTSRLFPNPEGIKSTYQIYDMPVAEVKQRYQLLNSSGNVVAEPLEADLGKIQRYRDMVGLAYSTCSLFSMLLLVSLMLGRSYISSCWDQWRLLTTAVKLRPENVPFSKDSLVALREQCDVLMEGTGTPIGGHACRPSSEQIVETCNHPPAKQPIPKAFAELIEPLLEESHGLNFGLTCQLGLCSRHDTFECLDTALLVMGCLLLIFTCCLLRPCAHQVIAMRRLQEAQARRSEHDWSRLDVD